MADQSHNTLQSSPQKDDTQRPPLLTAFGIEVTTRKLIGLTVIMSMLGGLWYWIFAPGQGVGILEARRVDVLVVADGLRRALPLESRTGGPMSPSGNAALLVCRDDPQGRWALVRASFSQKFLADRRMATDFNLILHARRIELSGTNGTRRAWFVPGLPKQQQVEVNRTVLGIEQPVKILAAGEHHTARGLRVVVLEQPQSYLVQWDPPAVGVRGEPTIKKLRGLLSSQRWEVTMLVPLPDNGPPYELRVGPEPVCQMSFD